MIKQIQKFVNIPFSNFLYCNGLIFKEKNVIFYITNILEGKINYDKDFTIEIVKPNCFLIRSIDQVDIYYDFKLSVKIDYYNINQIKDFNKKNILFVVETNNNWQLILFELRTKRKLWNTIEVNDLFYKLIDDYIIGYREKIICGISLINGKELWRKEFNELLPGEDIHQYGNIIEYEGKLYIYLADSRGSENVSTICLDITTGEVLNIFKGFAGNFLLQGSKLFVAGYEMVKILDLKTNQITELDFTKLLKPLNLQIHWNHSVIEGNLLYFVDGHWATTNKIGILDLSTKKLLWQTEIEITDDINKNIQEIKVMNNRLYVHCSDHTLHIFEKEILS